MLHGLGNDHHMWDADVAEFSAFHRVLRPDVRGFGRSDKPPGPYSTLMFAEDLAAILDAEGLPVAHLLGHSMGGVIAQRFALEYPSRVSSLTLASTSSEVGDKAAAAWHRLADFVEHHGFDDRTADASRAVSPSFARRCPDAVAELARRNAANDPQGYAAAARAVGDFNFTPELTGVCVPVLILQGLDDQLTPPGGSVKMSRVLPQSRLLLVAEAGHNLPLEQPTLFRASVLAFLGGVDGTRGILSGGQRRTGQRRSENEPT